MSTSFDRQPAAALRARLLSDVARTASTPPGAWGARLRIVAPFTALWAPVLAATMGQRSDMPTLPPYAAAIPLLSAVLAALGLSLLVTSRGRAMLGPSVASLWAATLLAPLALGVTSIVGLGAPWPAHMLALSEHGGMGCHAIALGIAAPLLVAFLWLRRGLPSASPAALGALAGVAAAAWAHGVLQWHCPSRDAVHIAFGHIAPALPLAALGAAAAHYFARRESAHDVPRVS